MAITFNGTSSDGITELAAPVADFPFTFSAWINCTSTATYIAFSIANADGSKRLAQVNISNLFVSVISYDGTTFGTIDGAHVGGGWRHILGRWASTSSRSVRVGGGSTATNTTALGACTPVDRAGYGRRNGAAASFFAGQMAEVGVWSVLLTDDEGTALAKGVSPAKVRPQALVRHIPMIRGIYDAKGNPLTVVGTTVSPHPRIYL